MQALRGQQTDIQSELQRIHVRKAGRKNAFREAQAQAKADREEKLQAAKEKGTEKRDPEQDVPALMKVESPSAPLSGGGGGAADIFKAVSGGRAAQQISQAGGTEGPQFTGSEAQQRGTGVSGDIPTGQPAGRTRGETARGVIGALLGVRNLGVEPRLRESHISAQRRQDRFIDDEVAAAASRGGLTLEERQGLMNRVGPENARRIAQGVDTVVAETERDARELRRRSLPAIVKEYGQEIGEIYMSGDENAFLNAAGPTADKRIKAEERLTRLQADGASLDNKLKRGKLDAAKTAQELEDSWKIFDGQFTDHAAGYPIYGKTLTNAEQTTLGNSIIDDRGNIEPGRERDYNRLVRHGLRRNELVFALEEVGGIVGGLSSGFFGSDAKVVSLPLEHVTSLISEGQYPDGANARAVVKDLNIGEYRNWSPEEVKRLNPPEGTRAFDPIHLDDPLHINALATGAWSNLEKLNKKAQQKGLPTKPSGPGLKIPTATSGRPHAQPLIAPQIGKPAIETRGSLADKLRAAGGAVVTSGRLENLPPEAVAGAPAEIQPRTLEPVTEFRGTLRERLGALGRARETVEALEEARRRKLRGL
jgi:hypothetical protein